MASLSYKKSPGAVAFAGVLNKNGKPTKQTLYYKQDTDDSDSSSSDEESLTFPEVKLSEGTFRILPHPKPEGRDIIYIAGTQGGGKSYRARQFCMDYHKQWPDRGIYLISAVDHDDTFDLMTPEEGRPKRINLQMLMQRPPKTETFFGSLVIFDDIDSVEPKLHRVLTLLLNDLAQNGRDHTVSTSGGKNGISLIFITHLLTNYAKTRCLLGEANWYVFYPKTATYDQLRYVLEKKVGCSQRDYDRARRIKGARGVAFLRYPVPLAMGTNECYILNQAPPTPPPRRRAKPDQLAAYVETKLPALVKKTVRKE